MFAPRTIPTGPLVGTFPQQHKPPRRRNFVNRRISVFLLAIASLVSIGSISSQAESVMTRHVRQATLTGQARLVGHLPATQVLQLDVVLPIRDQAGLDSFLAELYSSSVPNFRHFLTPAEFTEKFGPTQSDYNAVVQYALTHGLSVVGGSRDGMEVQVKGPVSAIESAFHVNMLTFQHPTENRIFYGPDREPSTDLNIQLWHISGLDNYSIPHPRFVRKSDYAKAHGISPDKVIVTRPLAPGPLRRSWAATCAQLTTEQALLQAQARTWVCSNILEPTWRI